MQKYYLDFKDDTFAVRTAAFNTIKTINIKI